LNLQSPAFIGGFFIGFPQLYDEEEDHQPLPQGLVVFFFFFFVVAQD